MINHKRKKIKIFLSSTILIFLSLVIIFSIIRFGIPLVTFISSFFSRKSTNGSKQSIEFIPPPYLFSPYQATNSAEFNIVSKSYIEGKIKVYLNGEFIKDIKTEKSEESTILIELQEGENNIYLISQNNKGEESTPSESLIVQLDTIPPDLEISTPAEGTTFSGNEQKYVQIIGKTEEDATVFVNDHQAVNERNGEFSLSYPLSEGENKLKAKAEDKAGNISEKEFTVFFTP